MTTKLKGRVTKAMAHYRSATVKGQNCHTCTYMRSDGTCDRVQGQVKPTDVCNLWRKRG